MHRTQIYLQDEPYERLKIRSSSAGINMSELIRQTLANDSQNDPVADARAYFERLKPLESFANVDSVDYVRVIRNKSRILQTAPK